MSLSQYQPRRTDTPFGAPTRRSAARDINKDGRPELFIDAAAENNGTGAVFVLPGDSARPTGTGARVYTGPSLGLSQTNGTLLGGNGLLWLI
ncbi:hypothetical protein [Streptomyces sp. NPDC003832]